MTVDELFAKVKLFLYVDAGLEEGFEIRQVERAGSSAPGKGQEDERSA